MIIFGLGVVMLILTFTIAMVFKKNPLLYETENLQIIDDGAITTSLKNSYQTERQNRSAMQDNDKTELLLSEQSSADKITELLEGDGTISL